jgi:hypothetical protein
VCIDFIKIQPLVPSLHSELHCVKLASLLDLLPSLDRTWSNRDTHLTHISGPTLPRMNLHPLELLLQSPLVPAHFVATMVTPKMHAGSNAKDDLKKNRHQGQEGQDRQQHSDPRCCFSVSGHRVCWKCKCSLYILLTHSS